VACSMIRPSRPSTASILDPAKKAKDFFFILVSMVNGQYNAIQFLETTNEFRIPDNTGNQRKKQCIDEELSIYTRLMTWN
jgi:hypothetical protein